MAPSRRILVTGSRLWTDRATIVLALAEAATKVLGEGETGDNLTVVHGAAMGADTLAAEAAPLMGMRVEAWPADWRREGRRAGPLRNKRLVAAGADICIAFPIGHSPGTRGCMREAEKAGIPVKVYEPARQT